MLLRQLLVIHFLPGDDDFLYFCPGAEGATGANVSNGKVKGLIFLLKREYYPDGRLAGVYVFGEVVNVLWVSASYQVGYVVIASAGGFSSFSVEGVDEGEGDNVV
jgi:hypothetical protein